MGAVAHLCGLCFGSLSGTSSRIIELPATGAAMLARYLKAQLIVLVCGGLVGPITRQYEIDWQASALVAGVVPAQITVSEDNKTYDLSGQAGPLMEIMQIYKANNLPFGGTVDIRNYPAVRQQVLAVARRAAEAQQPASAGGVAAPPQQSVAERLDGLEKLHASGSVSDAEYAASRQKIIADL